MCFVSFNMLQLLIITFYSDFFFLANTFMSKIIVNIIMLKYLKHLSSVCNHPLSLNPSKIQLLKSILYIYFFIWFIFFYFPTVNLFDIMLRFYFELSQLNAFFYCFCLSLLSSSVHFLPLSSLCLH